eukprot:CCRYP_010727-RA/>CCRYP_010727-RA protein AED:0.17 eAED:0.17 QI:319/1/1/1/0.71/0.62/8/3234/952
MMSSNPIGRSNNARNTRWHNLLFRAVFVCIVLNVLIQISFHLHLNRYLSLSSNLPFNPLTHRRGEISTSSNNAQSQSHKNDALSSLHLQKQPDLTHYTFRKDIAEKALAEYGRESIFQPLRAYVEKHFNDTVPNTVDTGDLDDKRPKIKVGRPGRWYVPLPLREGRPEDLRMFEYGQKLKSCNDLPAKLPVDRGFGNHATSNVNNRLTYASGHLDVWEEAKEGCPVNADPFLPWVHDLFPDKTGSVVHFIAQNKRRCNSGKLHIADILALQPQVTIMQPVSVQRIDEATALKLAPELWSPSDGSFNSTRYRLASHEESDADAMFTRFICRFRAMDFSQSPPNLVNVGETLSTYPYNYEFVNYRKDLGDLSMLTPKGKDNPMFWLSQLRFDCPIPDNGDLRSAIASGDAVLSDGTPSVYVDVVPIRTAPRYGKEMSYFTPAMAGDRLDQFFDKLEFSGLMKTNLAYTEDPRTLDRAENHPERLMKNGFDPWLFWGNRHVLPRIEASGRYENFPVCRHPGVGYTSPDDTSITKAEATVSKKHKLTACLWAAASFTTRGNAEAVSNTQSRLIEWIEFHLMVGFDHIYVYDNSGAHTDEIDLESTLFPRFLDSEVTRIDWPSRVCNNNIPAHENTGERSSQYAAENSCRARYGPYTEWMASFDTDEYLIPMGEYNSMVDVVDDAMKDGTQILTFRSTRASPIYSFMEPFHEHKMCGEESDPKCLRVKDDVLFAEAYNCDFDKSPKPEWSDRAKKQLYRPEYVATHYVHYATVTKGLLQTKDEATRNGLSWTPAFHESRKVDRITDEINQAVMLHTKTTVPEYTVDWQERCRYGVKNKFGENCRVGFPWPDNDVGLEKADADGFGYNCFTNQKLNDLWIPKLRDAMKKRNARVASLPPGAFTVVKKVKSSIKFCGFCKYKEASFDCNQRAAYLVKKNKITESEAKELLLAEGNCKPQ